MARKIKRVALSEQFKGMTVDAAIKRENNDCAVKALALVCSISYDEAHAALKRQGRKDGCATPTKFTALAAKELGFELWTWRFIEHCEMIESYPGVHKNLKSITTHHPRRFQKAWAAKAATKRLFLFVDSHVAAYIDGEVHDWTVNSARRVRQIWELVQKEDAQ